MQKVLEVRHHSPYDGCFEEWNYFLLEVTHNNRGEYVRSMTPIYSVTEKGKLPYHTFTLESARRFYDVWKAEKDDDGFPYDSPTVYEIDDKLDSHLPGKMTPVFWRKVPGFVWRCEECGLTKNQPVQMTDYRGNGGIGVEVDGWVCKECQRAYSRKQTVYGLRVELHHSFNWAESMNEDELAEQIVGLLEQDGEDVEGEDGAYFDRQKIEQTLNRLDYYPDDVGDWKKGA